MKNLKLFVFALCLLTMSLVTVFADDTVTSPEQCSSNSLYVDHKNGNFTCTSDLIAAGNSFITR